MEKRKTIWGSLLLLLAAFIWGGAFVAQSAGMDYIGPFTFNFVRSFIGGFVLLPVIIFGKRIKLSKEKAGQPKGKKLLLAGVLCGIMLSAGSLLQQIGIQYTTVGKAGFLTAIYIVIVPVLGIFFGKKPRLLLWCSVFTALAGTYLISVHSDFFISFGDMLMILSALFYSFHIMLVDYFAPHVDNIALSCLQLFVNGIISMMFAFALEKPSLPQVVQALVPLLYTGVLSSGLAYTLQIIGQRRVSAAAAPVIMSMESVFAALAGWVILRQSMSPREIFGCILVFAAVLLAQVPPGREKPVKQKRIIGKEKG